MTRRFETRHLAGLLLLVGVWAYSATVCVGENAVGIDEYAHVPAGISHWQLGRFALYRENPPLIRMLATIPTWASGVKVDYSRAFEGYRSEWLVGQDFVLAVGPSYQYLIARCRLVVLLLSAACGVLIFWWAAGSYGGATGLVCASLWFLDPTVMANSTLATTDIGTATFGLLATYLYARFLQKTSIGLCAASGVGLGLALGCKFSMLALIPSWLVLAVIARKLPGVGALAASGRGALRRTALVFLLGLLVLNVIYGFEGTGRPLGSFRFRSQLLSDMPSEGHQRPASGNRFDSTWMAGLPVPSHYLLGLDSQKWDDEHGFVRMSRGRIVHRGTLGSAVHTLLLKTPVGTLALVVFAAAYWAAKSRKVELPGAAFAITGGVFIVLISSQTGLNWVIRYCLPAYPFLILATAGPIRAAWSSRAGKVFVTAMIAWNACEFKSIHPFYHSYGNRIAGGPEGALRKFVGSNFDWGQDLLRLSRWSKVHPECKPLVVTFYGALNPTILAIGDAGVPMEFLPQEVPANPQPTAPRRDFYWAISSAVLNGLASVVLPENEVQSLYILDSPLLKPENAVERIGYSIYIFRIGDRDDPACKTIGFNRLRGCFREPTEGEKRTHASP